METSHDVKDLESTYLECCQEPSILQPSLNLFNSVHENWDVILLRARGVAKMIFHGPFYSNICILFSEALGRLILKTSLLWRDC